VAVPALCVGTADELALVVLDSPPGKPETIMERFVFSFDTADMNMKMRAVMDARGDLETRIGLGPIPRTSAERIAVTSGEHERHGYSATQYERQKRQNVGRS